MTREDAIKILKEEQYEHLNALTRKALDMAIKALQNQNEWIPIKKRPLTDEEKEYYSDLGYSSEEISFIYDCPLPDDGQSVLISNRYNTVEIDTFYHDYGCYFENNCDEDDVLAWTPLPEGYKKGAE